MGSGSSGIGGGSGGGSAPAKTAGGSASDQALTRLFLDGIATSQFNTETALHSAMSGSSFSLVSDTGVRTDFKKFDDDWDARWQQTITQPNGTITSQMMVDADRAALTAFRYRADVFSTNFKGAKAIPQKSVNVGTSEFVRAHGKAPSGKGNWAFDIGGQTVFFNGSYANAKKKAIAQAASMGIRQIMTLS